MQLPPPSPPMVISSLLKLLYQKPVPQLVPFLRGSTGEPDPPFPLAALPAHVHSCPHCSAC